MTLSEALQCPENEAQGRMMMRMALEHHGHFWALDCERAADSCDDQAANLPLTDQPRFAFLRGQATAFRRLARGIREMPESNARILELVNEQQGDFQ